jgi:hypothetical protein
MKLLKYIGITILIWFIALLMVGFTIGFFRGIAHGLSVAPTDCRNSSRTVCTDVMRQLTVEPVSVQHFSQLTEPNDIQPAYGYNGLQQTSNVQ